VSFDLTAGEALGLVGEPGSDKGTIAGAILERPAARRSIW
jgi:ABC-type oligopeptide transport system ATPase subunit